MGAVNPSGSGSIGGDGKWVAIDDVLQKNKPSAQKKPKQEAKYVA